MATVHAEAKAELLRQYQEIVTKYLTNISETVDVKAHFELKTNQDLIILWIICF